MYEESYFTADTLSNKTRIGIEMLTLRRIKECKIMQVPIAYIFLVTGLSINLVQLLLSLFVKPINPKLYRRINWYLSFSFNAQMVWVMEWWADTTIDIWISGDDEKYIGKEHALCIMNHMYAIDWLMAVLYTYHSGTLGNVKGFFKKSAKYLPIAGWGWKFAEFIFLNRSFDKDKEIIEKQVDNLMAHPDPVSLFLTPEGTRFTKRKHESSAKFALERGLPVLKHHLIPRTKGFTTILPRLRNKCAIYDVNVAFKKNDEYSPTLANLFKGYPVRCYMYVRRIPIETVPVEDKKAAEWLQDLFREKDRIQDSFQTTGNFFTTSGFKEPKKTTTKRRQQVLCNFVSWVIFSFSILLYWLTSMILTQNWIGLSIILGMMASAYFILQINNSTAEIKDLPLHGTDPNNNIRK